MTASLTVDLLTLFPEMVEGYFRCSMIGRAVQNGLLAIQTRNIRDWATDKHKLTDDRPFGGGAGMVMKPEPMIAAIESVRTPESHVIYLAPDGERLTRSLAKELAGEPHLILVSGHYEGIDQRIRDGWVDREISIGDYVLTNGTLAAAVLIDCVARFVPGVLGDPESVGQDSFTDDRLSFPQYTRPAEFRGMKVPEVLMSGNHAEINEWRNRQQIERTLKRRPDLVSSN